MVDDASKVVPPVSAPPEALHPTSVGSQQQACRESTTSEVAAKQLPCKAPPKGFEQLPFKPPIAEVVSEVATGVPKVPTKALPTNLVVKAPPPQFAR